MGHGKANLKVWNLIFIFNCVFFIVLCMKVWYEKMIKKIIFKILCLVFRVIMDDPDVSGQRTLNIIIIKWIIYNMDDPGASGQVTLNIIMGKMNDW